MIVLNAISKRFGTKEVLKNISLSFESGKVHGIVGENGAGKTTLFKCIAGLELCEGTIDSAFQPIKDHIGYLSSEPYFFSHITGMEYIRLFCEARRLPLTSETVQNLFDLPLNQYAQTYSTGMKKKLALTALLHQPNSVFILDEPFNGVDIQSNLLITAIIHKLKEAGKTVIISSHIFSTLKETCDEIYQLSGGEIVERVEKERFNLLEESMKSDAVSDQINRLIIR